MNKIHTITRARAMRAPGLFLACGIILLSIAPSCPAEAAGVNGPMISPGPVFHVNNFGARPDDDI
ncbi:MAG: hypothetical protein LBM92_01775, partial [Opitutaceae bacterium]|nr:hypothetical protein [Opitutaceae bacterium]